jgi:hypothetical protein
VERPGKPGRFFVQPWYPVRQPQQPVGFLRQTFGP